MNDNKLQSVQEEVLTKIREGKVHRRTRAYFLLRIVATLVVGALLLATASFLFSFIFFSLHESGEQFLLGFGWRGVQVFLTLFPWLPLVYTLVLMVLLQWLLKGFRFSYRRPVLYIFAAIAAISLLFGLGLSLTPLHATLLDAADHGELPVFGDVYEHILAPHDDRGVCRGEIVSETATTIVVKHDDQDHDADEQDLTIAIPQGSDTALPPVGSRVLILCHQGAMGLEEQRIQEIPQLGQ